jgi:hypothetical protein
MTRRALASGTTFVDPVQLPYLHLLSKHHNSTNPPTYTTLSAYVMDSSRNTRDRSRSRSPRPERSSGAPKPKKFSGLKYKDDHRDDRDRRDPDRRRDDRDRERRPRDSDRDRERRPRDSSRERRPRDSDRDRKPRDSDRERRPREDSDRKESTKPTAAAPPASTEAMILVTINDRLGTKTQVPCLPSDPIKLLKAMVAAKIGRPVHEIMLKRQGERPFHDNLTCADYAISNGVQIDLELNTGD